MWSADWSDHWLSPTNVYEATFFRYTWRISLGQLHSAPQVPLWRQRKAPESRVIKRLQQDTNTSMCTERYLHVMVKPSAIFSEPKRCCCHWEIPVVLSPGWKWMSTYQQLLMLKSNNKYLAVCKIRQDFIEAQQAPLFCLGMSYKCDKAKEGVQQMVCKPFFKSSFLPPSL